MREMKHGARRIVLALTLVLTAAAAVYFSRGDHAADSHFTVTIGPRSLAPIPKCEPVTVSKPEFDAVRDSVVRHEQWFGSLAHADIRYSVESVNHPPALKRMREDIQRQFPNLEISAESFSYLVPKHSSTHKIAFDKTRFAFTKQSSIDEFSQSMVWDGSVATGVAGPGDAPRNYFLPSFATKPDPNEPLKMLVFNFRDTDEAIRKKLAPYKVTCPVFVPNTDEKHPSGDLFAEYRIRGMPTTVVLAGDGVIDSYREGMFSDEQ